MNVIPARRLTRSDMRRLGNNVLPHVLADRRQYRARPAAGPDMPLAIRAACDPPAELAAINRSLAVHGEAVRAAG